MDVNLRVRAFCNVLGIQNIKICGLYYVVMLQCCNVATLVLMLLTFLVMMLFMQLELGYCF